MLKIKVPATELFNEDTSEFIIIKEQELLLEHSLVSVSKWESKWKKAFIDPYNSKTLVETLDYVRCMTITKGVNPLVYKCMSNSVLDKINEYIEDPMTATTFVDFNQHQTTKKITSEEIYQWMVALKIPFECEKWHLNRLLTFIRVCSIKQQDGKKMTSREVARSNAEINAMRRANMRTKG